MSMWSSRRKLGALMNLWPGKKTFGLYRFLPIFFILGAAVEFSMIKWHVGEVNFYSVYKKKQAERIALKDHEMNARLAATRDV